MAAGYVVCIQQAGREEADGEERKGREKGRGEEREEEERSISLT